MIYPERLRALGLGHIFNVTTGDIAPGTVLTNTPPLSLWNPADSRTEFVALLLGVGLVSGTIGAGHVQAAYCEQIAAPTVGAGADLTAAIRTSRIGFLPAPASKAKAYCAATIAASPPTVLRPVAALGAGSEIPDAEDLLISVRPGYLLCFQGLAGAGTSPVVHYSLVWAEYGID
jgi:hypothetical protein